MKKKLAKFLLKNELTSGYWIKYKHDKIASYTRELIPIGTIFFFVNVKPRERIKEGWLPCIGITKEDLNNKFSDLKLWHISNKIPDLKNKATR